MKIRFLPLLAMAAVILSEGHAQAWQMKSAPLMTRWASQVDTNAPLPEYPRPQLVRKDWLNLNGLWQFQGGESNDPVPAGKNLAGEILVPYPMESPLSGVMKYFPNSWYRRTFTVPTEWSGRRIILHLDAVDWESEVFINGARVGGHKGGYDPAVYDITDQIKGVGPQELIVRAYAPVDSAGEPRGKQTLYPHGIMYTSSSGIWQPVWLEPVDAAGVSDLKITPDVDHSRVNLTVSSLADGVVVTVSSNGVPVAHATGVPNQLFSIPIPQPALWSPEHPFLYGLRISALRDGSVKDTVASYFGMRKISTGIIGGVKKILLNNQFLFQIGPLDQGFWPDGNYTAPTDEALRSDIEQEKALGFNMVRKHIKVERARWYYWADKLGILVWQDMPSVNSYTRKPQPIDVPQFRKELNRLVETHGNSPAIIMWVLFNESQGQHDTAALAHEIAAKDPSRLVNQASGGGYFDAGDVLDVHSYPAPNCLDSATQVRVCGEFGGIGCQVPGHLWNPAKAGGNYTKADDTAELAHKYDQFINDIVDFKSNRGLSGAVYTEITDCENECNGLLTYDRVMKADVNLIRASNLKAIREELALGAVLPDSSGLASQWQYTTNAPAGDWFVATFDDARWPVGLGGFGSGGRTDWRTPEIWLRREFTLGALTPKELDGVVFHVCHQGGCEIYLNGVLAGKFNGRTSTYELEPMAAEAKAALIPNGTNVIAVHGHQGPTGGQFIDVGLSMEQFSLSN